MLTLFSILTIILYFLSTFLQGFCLKNHSPTFTKITTISGFFTIFAHGALLFLFIYYYHNLTLSKLISLAFWFINLLACLSALEKRSIQKLTLFTFPLAALSLLLVLLFNHEPSFIDTSNSKQLFHIILSTLTFTTILLGAIQAIILTIQDRKLRKYHRGFFSLLPSIESMENFLFQILTIGFFLFTALLISSIVLFSEIDSHKLINKLILSFSVWVVLGILLVGRFYSGWRGVTVIRWTLLGASLLTLIYFGSLFSKYIILLNYLIPPKH